MTRLDDIAVSERAEWAKLHAAALDAFDRGEVYAYHSAADAHSAGAAVLAARLARGELSPVRVAPAGAAGPLELCAPVDIGAAQWTLAALAALEAQERHRIVEAAR